jgi:hypothetical protein
MLSHSARPGENANMSPGDRTYVQMSYDIRGDQGRLAYCEDVCSGVDGRCV